MLKDKFIVFYSGTNWELPWGLSQEMMIILSKSNKVIFLEYQPSFLHCYLGNLSYKKYTRENRGVFKELTKNLLTYMPKAGLPFNNYFRIINSLNQ